MSNQCLVTTLKASVENSSLKKLGELRLKAISDGTLTIRPKYGNVVLNVMSGSASYSGEPFVQKELEQGNAEISISVTNGTVLSIENKYALDELVTTVMELTDGDTLESLYYQQFYRIGLAGSTSGSISGLDTTILAHLLLDDTNVEGSIDIFANSTAVTRIQIQNTKVSGNLSSLINKSLQSSCHFQGSDIMVDLADIASMSSGNTAMNKYMNCYLYGDASSLPADTTLIYAQPENKIMNFTWLTQRHNVSGAYIISNQYTNGTRFMDYGTYLDVMLLDQAQCQAPSSGDKTIHVFGSHTDNSGWEAAVATLKSKGYIVIINDETL